MSAPLRLSVTEAGLGARCPRQMVLAREGLRVTTGDGPGIGTALHEVAANVVRHALEDTGVVSALDADTLARETVGRAVATLVHREVFEALLPAARTLPSAALVRLAEAATGFVPLLATLLERAHRRGFRGRESVAAVFLAVEKEVGFTTSDGLLEVRGRIDLLLRDVEADRPYVCDWKTAGTDVAAEEQVRLYARALEPEHGRTLPVLVHVDPAGVRLSPLAPEDGALLETRLKAIATWLDGSVPPPPAANPETCRTCPVQRPCWTRWGRTVEASRPSNGTGSLFATDPLADEARRLEKSLRTRKIPVESVDPKDAVVGPSVIRYRVKLRAGGEVEKISRRAADLQREMGWTRMPVVMNDGAFVAIDAPREPGELVPWSRAPLLPDHELVVPVGIGLDGNPVTLDLAQAPHLLVAGTPGSGKTIFLQGLVLALLGKDRRPDVHVVDPKALDFVAFDGMPLAGPVITDPRAAISLLQRLADEEMESRTAFLAGRGVRSRLELDSEELPATVVVVDELADLVAVLSEKKERAAFTTAILRLLQRARAVGIHLVLATQRPSVDVVPGLMKANLPVRIAFQLPTVTDSTTILDHPGAERLLGRGDLLLSRAGQQDVRAQGYFVAMSDIAARVG